MDRSTEIVQPDMKSPSKVMKGIAVFIGNILKRSFDIVASLLGIFFLLPWLAIIAHFIKRDSPGPIFHKCDRMGKGERPFKMYKFRTMYEDPSSYAGPKITYDGDTRITPFGGWLRDTKINELPQLWNVLKGEMSLVGPRPEDVDIARGWPEEVRREVLSVRPGITSPASIVYHDEEHRLSKDTVMEDYLRNILPDKMRLDRLYVRNRSFGSDLDILFWTMITVIPRMTRARIPEGYLFAGPISRFINRNISWFIIDLLISLAVVGVVGFLWRNQAPINWGVGPLATFSVILAFTFSGLNAIIGLNKIVWSKATVADAMALSLSCWVVTLILLILDYLQIIFRSLPIEPLPILMLFTIGLLAQFFFMAVRFRLRLITAVANRWLTWRKDRMKIGERVLIVGAGEAFHTANWLLRRGEYQFLFTIVGVVGDEILAEHGMKMDGCLVLGSLADLPAIVKKKEIDVIVFTIPNLPPKIKDIAFDLYEKSGVKLVFLHNLTQIVTRQLTLPVHRSEFTRWSENYLGYLDLHDSVTGLPNRFLFEDRLLHSVAFSHRYRIKPIVLFIDIIGFREHDVKLELKDLDRILVLVSERLRRQKREGDTLAFIGEDRFGFILENINDDSVIPAIAKRLSASLTQPFLLEGKNLHIRASVSVCTEIESCAEGSSSARGSDILKTLIEKSNLILEI